MDIFTIQKDYAMLLNTKVNFLIKHTILKIFQMLCIYIKKT